jgi:hypothetical protein
MKKPLYRGSPNKKREVAPATPRKGYACQRNEETPAEYTGESK